MNDIGYEDRKNFAKRGYNDKPERNAFRKFVKEDDKTRNLIYGYMIDKPGISDNCKTKFNPIAGGIG